MCRQRRSRITSSPSVEVGSIARASCSCRCSCEYASAVATRPRCRIHLLHADHDGPPHRPRTDDVEHRTASTGRPERTARRRDPRRPPRPAATWRVAVPQRDAAGRKTWCATGSRRTLGETATHNPTANATDPSTAASQPPPNRSRPCRPARDQPAAATACRTTTRSPPAGRRRQRHPEPAIRRRRCRPAPSTTISAIRPPRSALRRLRSNQRCRHRSPAPAGGVRATNASIAATPRGAGRDHATTQAQHDHRSRAQPPCSVGIAT